MVQTHHDQLRENIINGCFTLRAYQFEIHHDERNNLYELFIIDPLIYEMEGAAPSQIFCYSYQSRLEAQEDLQILVNTYAETKEFTAV